LKLRVATIIIEGIVSPASLAAFSLLGEAKYLAALSWACA